MERELQKSKWLDPKLMCWWHNFFIKALDPRPNSSLFDLGTGPGYLLWFARELRGCKVRGLERFEREDYRELWKAMNLERVIQTEKIEPLKKINFPGTFDYISATGINFTRPLKRKWNAKEHFFFLCDVREHLNPEGEVFLTFNYPPPREVVTFLSKAAFWKRGEKFFKIKKEALNWL